MSTLDQIQTDAAKDLRVIRPAVIQGSNVIPNRAEQLAYFHIVTAVMAHYAITSAAQCQEFCDIAGVPD